MKPSTILRRGPLGIVATAAALGLGFSSAATAAPSSASVENDTLTVIGTGDGESLALRLKSGDPNTLEVDFGDDGSADQSFDRTTFNTIVVQLKPGDDQFRVDQVNGPFADEALTVEGGNGDDVINGGDGIETLDGGNGDDEIDGNRGNDTGILGTGHDSFRWDPGDGSDIVEGNSGQDTLDFNGAAGVENMSLSAEGGRAIFFRDAANIRMDMDNVEKLDLTTLGGVDTMTVNDMKSTDFNRADIDLGNDGLADTVTVNGTSAVDNIDVEPSDGRVKVGGLSTETHIVGHDTVDKLQVNTSGGDDDVDVDSEIIGQLVLAFDLGAQN